MLESRLSEAQIKDLVKAAILEILQERRDLLKDLMAEALADLALVKSINEGKESESVDRETIFGILESDL